MYLLDREVFVELKSTYPPFGMLNKVKSPRLKKRKSFTEWAQISSDHKSSTPYFGEVFTDGSCLPASTYRAVNGFPLLFSKNKEQKAKIIIMAGEIGSEV